MKELDRPRWWGRRESLAERAHKQRMGFKAHIARVTRSRGWSR